MQREGPGRATTPAGNGDACARRSRGAWHAKHWRIDGRIARVLVVTVSAPTWHVVHAMPRRAWTEWENRRFVRGVGTDASVCIHGLRARS